MQDKEVVKLKEALKVSPENDVLRELLADALLKHREFSEAEKEFSILLGKVPGSQDYRFGLAQAYFGLGDVPAALLMLEELIKLPDVLEEIPPFYDKVAAEANKGRSAGPGKSGVTGGRIRVPSTEEAGGPAVDFELPTLSFKDVGGMEKVKEEARLKIIAPLENPEIYKAYGKPAGGGILLYGPPGCGKTYLAKATAGEARLGFISVGISDILDMWLGSSERNLHEYFEAARKKRPCVLFFDEVDALGASRSDMKTHAGRQVINQFLTELDGSRKSNEGVLIIGATNAPWHLDTAFRRPGRFDRIIFVPPPDEEARAAILKILLKNRPAEAVEIEEVAEKADKFSGADLKAAVDVAVESKLGEAIKKKTPQPLQTADLLAAVKKIKPSVTEWFQTARNYAVYANESGFYNDILSYLEETKR